MLLEEPHMIANYCYLAGSILFAVGTLCNLLKG